VTRITGLYASQRTRAYKIVDPSTPFDASQARAYGTAVDVAQFLQPAQIEAALTATGEPGDMQSVFGALQPWDRYLITSNANANYAFYFYNVARLRGYEVDYTLPRFGRMFLKNVLFVRTFVTDAALDLVVYSPAIPSAL